MRPAILALALAALACGGGPAGPPDAPPEDAGAGAPPAGASDGGGGDAGGEPGGSSLAAVTLERLDGSGDCAGLVPDRAPEPISLRRAPPAGATCIGGNSDGTGAVAVGARGPDAAVTWQVFAPDGSPRGAFAADAPVVPAPAGWHALSSTGPQGDLDPRVEHLAIAPDGSVARRGAVSPDPAVAVYPRWNLAADPSGGSLVAMRSSALAGNHWSSVAAHRFDASGGARWPGGAPVRIEDSASEPMFLAGGVSVAGEALVLSQDSAFLDVSWLDARTGAPIAGASAEQSERSAEVVGETLRPDLQIAPLLDGGLAVRADGTFRRAYARLATTSSPLPPWLAERAASTFRFTRRNAGYAVFPPPGAASADCTQRIDLVSPSGRLCGRVVLREGGSGCTSGAVDQGWDGTVVQQSARDACAYRVFPRLLAR